MLDRLAVHSDSRQLDQVQSSADRLLQACMPWLHQRRSSKPPSRQPSKPAKVVLSTLAGALSSLDISYTAEVRPVQSLQGLGTASMHTTCAAWAPSMTCA